MEEMTTITDECIITGAPQVIVKNGGYLSNLVERIAENYDSADFDGVALLGDIQLAKDNCRTIIEVAELTLETLEKLKKELTER